MKINAKQMMQSAMVAMLVGLATTANASLSYWWNGNASANYTSQNWESPSGTPTAATPGTWDQIYNTKGGKVILTNYKDPGYFNFATGELEIQAGGTLNLQGSGGGVVSQGPATLTINGGSLLGYGSMGAMAAGATVNLQAGSWTYSQVNAGNGFYSSGGSTPARINQTGGTLAVGSYSLILGQQEQWNDKNGDYYFGNAAGSAGAITGSGNLIVGNIANKMAGSGYQRTTYGQFIGYGTVGLTGTLRNNGYITADGYGTDRTLNLSSFTAVDNTVDNNQYKLTGDNNYYYGKGGTGWFATRQGKLTLPSLSIAAGNSTRNWGEPDSDAAIDLINSARLTLKNVVGGGTLTGSLLAKDRTDVAVPPVGYNFISVHEFTNTTGFSLASFDLVIRYDAAAAGQFENRLEMFQYTGGNWVKVPTTLDTANHLIYANGLTSFGQFGIGLIPEPSTLFLLACGGWVLYRARRQQ